MAKKTSKNRPARSAPLAGRTDNFAGIRAAKQEWSKRLLARRSLPASRALSSAISPDPELNLMGVGIGEKLVDGRRTGVMCVKFLVRAKYHEKHISLDHILPKSIDGLPVDVEEVGLMRRFDDVSPRTHIRPAQPGCSVGFDAPSGDFRMAGTFGALVEDANGLYILSNNHVLADENQLSIDSPIFQPGLYDGGDQATDRIAQLTNFLPLQQGVLNQVDCAIAAVTDPSAVSNAIPQIGPPKGVGEAQNDMTVHKFGRSTQYTAGQVTSVETDMTLQYDTGSFTFAQQIVIVGFDGQPFAAPGDSGSLILERNTNLAVGLLIGGSGSHFIANHIGDVLTALNVTLA